MKEFQFLFLLTFLFSCHSEANSSHPKQHVESEENLLVSDSETIINTNDSILQISEISAKTDEIVEDNSNPEIEKEIIPSPDIASKDELNQEDSIDSLSEIESTLEDTKLPESSNISSTPILKNFHDHKLWDQLLKSYVDDQGNVNYAAFKKDESSLDTYLSELKENPILPAWSRNQKMAYWINSYNAFTIKLILKNYPVSSIMDIHGGKAWDVKWIQIGANTYSLNQIENEILRPVYKDARIHFAVNCAAKSCPPLWNHAFTEQNLEESLALLTKKFINNSLFNSLDYQEVKVSKIFEWYAEDFGNLISFLNNYAVKKVKNDANISFSTYDWALNSK